MGDAAIAAAAAETSETESTEAETPLREQLIAKVKDIAKERDEAKAARGDAKPEKPKAKPDEKKPAAESKEKPKADKPDEEKPPTPDELKAQKRDLAKFSRKLEGREAAVGEREKSIASREQRFASEAQQREQLFERDPVGWLRSRGVDVKGVLLRHAQEDAEDPKEKKLREVAEEQKQTKAELDAIKKREEDAAAERQKDAAGAQIERNLRGEYESADSADYPLLATLSTPEKVAAIGRRVLVEHWRKTARSVNGQLVDGEELAPAEVFAILEAELRAHEARSKATGKKPEPPDRVRSVPKREPESPETSQSTRSARDVTNRTARVRSADEVVGKSGLDRGALREKLVGMVREGVR